MKTLIALLLLTGWASAYTKAQIYELKNLKTTAYAAKDAAAFYEKSAEKIGKKLAYQEKVLNEKKSLLESKKNKASCRSKTCKHTNRTKKCYKAARTLNSLAAEIKKQKSIVDRTLKDQSVQKKFAEKKASTYKALVQEYLKKKAEWK